MAQPKQHTPAERARVVSFAMAHGPRAAARRFGIPLGTVKGWTHRATHPQRRRPSRPRPATPTPAATSTQTFDEQVRRLAAWAAGGCIRCAGDGTVDIPAVTRGGLVIRRPRRLPCPECGGRVRHLEVVELPRAEWFQGLKTAGDLGAGWRPDQWGEVLAGGDPDGYRFSDGDRLEPGAGSP